LAVDSGLEERSGLAQYVLVDDETLLLLVNEDRHVFKKIQPILISVRSRTFVLSFTHLRRFAGGTCPYLALVLIVAVDVDRVLKTFGPPQVCSVSAILTKSKPIFRAYVSSYVLSKTS